MNNLYYSESIYKQQMIAILNESYNFVLYEFLKFFQITKITLTYNVQRMYYVCAVVSDYDVYLVCFCCRFTLCFVSFFSR